MLNMPFLLFRMEFYWGIIWLIRNYFVSLCHQRDTQLTLFTNHLKHLKSYENEQDMEDYSSSSELHRQCPPWSSRRSGGDVRRLIADG
jgi:hypothetical protein